MNPIAPGLKTVAICILLFVMKTERVSVHAGSGAEPSKSACGALERRQFDFWAGDWDAYDADNLTKVVARCRVDIILDGCVLREEYKDTNGLKGQSFSIYDASRKLWHQSWVTNQGRLLVIEGRFEHGEMVLTGVDRTPNGEERYVRGTWKPVAGGVRETAVISTDGGKSWKPWFDLVFRPHKL